MKNIVYPALFPKPNYYYRKESIPSAIQLNKTYSDTYSVSGLSEHRELGSIPENKLILFAGNVPNDSKYGGGMLRSMDMYFSALPAFNISAVGASYDVKLYDVNANTMPTPGNLKLQKDSNDKIRPIAVFHSEMDYTKSTLLEETFDGQDKGFMSSDRATGLKTSYVLSAPNILRHQANILDICYYFKHNAKKTYIQYKPNSIHSFPTEYVSAQSAYGWNQYTLNDREGWTDLVPEGGEYRTSAGFTATYTSNSGDEQQFPKMSLDAWKDSGITIEQVNINKEKIMIGEETYQDRCTPLNSIFFHTYESPNIRDIKVQTIESTGDNDKTYSNTQLSFTSDDYKTGGQSLRMYSLWENYSGSLAANVVNQANPFGWVDPDDAGFTTMKGYSAAPQEVYASLSNIPQPTPNECGMAVKSTTWRNAPDSASAFPAMEITFKIESLPPTNYLLNVPLIANDIPMSTRGIWMIFGTRGIYQTNNGSVPSYNVMQGDADNRKAENLNQYVRNMTSGSRDGAENLAALFFYVSSGNQGTCNVQSLFQGTGGDSQRSMFWLGESAVWTALGGNDADSNFAALMNIQEGNGNEAVSQFDTVDRKQIPVGEWVTMRIVPPFANVSGGAGSGIGYYQMGGQNNAASFFNVEFPDLVTTDPDEIQSLKMYSGRPNTRSGALAGNWPHIFTMGTVNMRCMNDPASSATYACNMPYTTDATTHEDETVSVLIDNISFKQWNNNIVNATAELGNTNRVFTMPSPPNAITRYDKSDGNYSRGGPGYEFGPNGTTPSTLSFGFDTPDVSGAMRPSGDKGNLLLNNFKVINQFAADRIENNFMVGGISTSGQFGGYLGPASGSNAICEASPFNVKVNSNSSASGSIWTSGNTNVTYGVDNFTQKGYVVISGGTNWNTSNTTRTAGHWVKRENPFVKAHILDVQGNEITVDRPEIFDMPIGEGDSDGGVSGTRYVVYKAGTPYNALRQDISGTGYVEDDLFQIARRKGNVIYLNRSIESDSAGNALAYPTPDEGVSSLTNCMISPKKYWVWLHYYNGQGYGSTSAYGEINGYTWGVWNPNMLDSDGGWKISTSGTIVKNNQSKSYSGVLSVSGNIENKGTTYNEVMFTEGRNKAAWNLNHTSEESDVSTDIDYGYGVLVMPEDTETGVGISSGYVTEFRASYDRWDTTRYKDNYFNIDNYLELKQFRAGDTYRLLLVPNVKSFSADEFSPNTLKISASGGTAPSHTTWLNVVSGSLSEQQPAMYYGYHNPVPSIRNFEVKPTIDLLEEDDIYQNMKGSDRSFVNFEWDELRGANIWYRLLFVDTEFIQNKYHKVDMWAPFSSIWGSRIGQGSVNAALPHVKSLGRLPTYQVNAYTTGDKLEAGLYPPENFAYNFAGSGAYVTLGEGAFRAYGLSISGNTGHVSGQTATGYDNFPFAANQPAATWIVHARPAAAAASSSTIYEYSGGAIVSISGSKVYSSLKVGSNWYTCTSVTSYACNDEQPLAIITTFNKDKARQRMSLFINGKLEDTSDAEDSNAITGGNVRECFVGGNGSARTSARGSREYFSGHIEEFIALKTCAYVMPDSREYTLDTTPLTNFNNNKSNTYQARMFAVDYHNIAGMNSTEVATSDTTSWKVTGVN